VGGGEGRKLRMEPLVSSNRSRGTGERERGERGRGNKMTPVSIHNGWKGAEKEDFLDGDRKVRSIKDLLTCGSHAFGWKRGARRRGMETIY